MWGWIIVSLIIYCWLYAEIFRFVRWLRRPKDWREYEFYVAKKLRQEGWKNVKVQAGRKDHGKDIVGYFEGEKRVVQVKKHKAKVGPIPVSGIAITGVRYKAKPMIVSTNGFTKEAIKYGSLAKVTLRQMSI